MEWEWSVILIKNHETGSLFWGNRHVSVIMDYVDSSVDDVVMIRLWSYKKVYDDLKTRAL